MNRGKRGVMTAVLACAAAGAGGEAQAQQQVTQGGWASDNVEWVRSIESPGQNIGGKLVGTTFFMHNWQVGLIAYDVSKPESPREAGRIELPFTGVQGEDVATNGKVALVPTGFDPNVPTGSDLQVVDVSDPANMKLLATLPGAGGHTVECLFDCTWAYAANGGIIDLRDPAKPVLRQENWADVTDAPAHDTTEVRPGLVVTVGGLMNVLDTTDPVAPKIVAKGSEEIPHQGHNMLWPRQGQDRFLISLSEASHLGRCEAYEQADMTDGQTLQVWDTTDWEKTKTFRPVGSWSPRNGTQIDGNPVVSADFPQGCSSHWFDPHPTFRDGGLIAEAAFSHGLRLLDIDAKGQPKETGYFMSHRRSTVAVYWAPDARTIYVLDVGVGGIDVVHYTGPLPDRPAEGGPNQVVEPPRKRCVSRRNFRIRLREPRGDRLVSARVYVNGKRVRVVRGKRLTAPVDLRGLPKGRFKVRIVARTRKGRTISNVRRYRTCEGTSRP